jgi:cytochrome c biogenesis protein CcdA
MELWTFLLPVLLTDVVNPVLFAFLVYVAGTNRPVLLSSSMLLGHTAAYFSAGVVLATFMENITSYLASPHTIDFLIELVLGVILLWLAFASKKDTGKRPDEDTTQFTVLTAFGFGAIINFIGIPFAIPYFAAIDQILKADLSVTESIMALAGYNLVYALPFMMVPLLSAVMGERARPLLSRANAVLDKISTVLMPLMLGLIGLALLVDGFWYFFAGAPLF